MRKLLRKMKRNRLRKRGRNAVAVGLTAGLMLTTAGITNAEVVDWNTTTVDLAVHQDVTKITDAAGLDGRVVNLSLLGLDEMGNVDVTGEAGGSEIIASVTTVLGETAGGDEPASPVDGAFAVDTGYYKLSQGTGRASVSYDYAVEGNDVITVTLFEKRNDAGGNAMTRQIAQKVVNVAVSKVENSAIVLDIDQVGNSSLIGVVSAPTRSSIVEKGLDTGITAGTDGNTVVVWAYERGLDGEYTVLRTVNGKITLDFDGEFEVTGSMIDGMAFINLPSNKIEKAGKYRVVATMDNGATSDLPILHNGTPQSDFIEIVAETTPEKIKLTSDVVSVQDANAGTVNYTVTLLDRFGNPINPAGYLGTTVEIEDSENLLTDETVTIAAGANEGTGSAKASAAIAAGTISDDAIVTATAPGISSSDPLTIKVMEHGLTSSGAGAFNTITAIVGSEMNLFNGTSYGIRANSGDPLPHGAMFEITNLATGEKVTTAGFEAGSNLNFKVNFKKAATNQDIKDNGFLFHLMDNTKADYIIKPTTTLAFKENIPAEAKLLSDVDQEGSKIEEVKAVKKDNGEYEVTINFDHLYTYDAEGNESGNDVNTAQVKVTSAKGELDNEAKTTYGTTSTVRTITYPAGTTEDTVTLQFTDSADNIPDKTFKVAFPSRDPFDHFALQTDLDPIELPVNGSMPLDILLLDANGERALGIEGGFTIDVPTELIVEDWNTGSAIPVGAGTSWNEETSRVPLEIKATSTEGTYTFKVFSVNDPTVSEEVEITVKSYDNPLSLGDDTVTIEAGQTKDIDIIGGSTPYTAASGDTSVVTASVSGNTLTLTAVAQGTATVTVTDADSATAEVAVTVSAAGAVIPSLGDAAAVDGNGNPMAVDTSFNGGIAVSGGDYLNNTSVSETDAVDVKFVIEVDDDHQGEEAELVFLAGMEGFGWFIKPENDTDPWALWDGDLSSLTAFRTIQQLNSEESVSVFAGQLTGFAGATIQAYIGYRLADGTLVWNPTPVKFDVTK